jgi:cobyrinic acid a,c-diamide synthase
VPSPSVGARGLVIAAPASGQGKTVITLGLLRALRDTGVGVASAKVGPDYIDPQFHRVAAGGECVNLDAWAMRPGLLLELATSASVGGELFLVEGVMGLFDGAVEGGGSTADLATLLGLPVVLVVDAGRQGQSVAALVEGFAKFRPDCEVAGVIFNRVGGARHGEILRRAVAATGLAIFGAVPARDDLALPSRHLGLVQATEREDLPAFIDRAAAVIAEHLDLAALRALARPLPSAIDGTNPLAPLGQRMAVARDEAFSFAYPHLLAGWRRAGAEVLPFSPLADEGPPRDADAVFLPGGYPELHGGRLAAAERFFDGLRAAAAGGVPIYGECGGYMVLGNGLTDSGACRHAMAGLLPLETSFAERRLHLGYCDIESLDGVPWPGPLRGHEFHYATVAAEGQGDRLYSVRYSGRSDPVAAGQRRGSVMGSFIHVIDAV